MDYLVTVAITAYNRPKTLRQTLQSIVNQSYKNLEIIVIDDYSDDNNVQEVVKEFQRLDKRISAYKQNKNKGLEENLNYCIKLAKGNFFLWVNDDDWIDTSYIEKCLNYKLKTPGYAVVCGRTKFYQEDKFAFDGEVINVKDDSGFKRVLSFYDQQLGTANCPNFGIISKDDIAHVPLKKILGHDNVWVANLAYVGKIKTLDDTYIYRRLGGLSESLGKCARIFNYSGFELNFPFLALWRNIVKDIAFESFTYKPLGGIKRFYLAVCLTGLISFRFSKYMKRYKMRTKGNRSNGWYNS